MRHINKKQYGLLLTNSYGAGTVCCKPDQFFSMQQLSRLLCYRCHRYSRWNTSHKFCATGAQCSLLHCTTTSDRHCHRKLITRSNKLTKYVAYICFTNSLKDCITSWIAVCQLVIYLFINEDDSDDNETLGATAQSRKMLKFAGLF